MKRVGVHEAKTHLSRLLRSVAAGEEIIIAKGDKPIAKLVPFAAALEGRPLGLDAGKVQIASDFDAPLPPDVLDEFER